jgi:hypothetical protein
MMSLDGLRMASIDEGGRQPPITFCSFVLFARILPGEPVPAAIGTNRVFVA